MRREMTHSAVTRFAEPLATEAQSRSRIADGSARNEGLNSGSKPGIVCAKYSQVGMAVVALPRPGIRSEWGVLGAATQPFTTPPQPFTTHPPRGA